MRQETFEQRAEGGERMSIARYLVKYNLGRKIFSQYILYEQCPYCGQGRKKAWVFRKQKYLDPVENIGLFGNPCDGIMPESLVS